MVLKKQAFALQYALSHDHLFQQKSACGYFWKDNKIIHVALGILYNQNEMINHSKVKSVNCGKLSDDKNKFLASNIVSIVAGIPTHSILNYMKHIDVSRNTKYKLFRRGNVKRKQWIRCCSWY